MTIPAGVIVAWPSTNASIPCGWDRVTDLDDRFPLGAPDATNPNVTGGAATHTHATSHTHTVGSHTHAGLTTGAGSGTVSDGSGGSPRSTSTHTHAAPTTGAQTSTLDDSGSVVTTSGSSIPSAFEVIWIESDGTPAGIPDGAWVFWDDTSAPSGWTAQSGPAGRYLKGAAAAGDGGGTAGGAHTHSGVSHTHVIADHTHTGGNTGEPSATTTVAPTGAAVPDRAHTHAVTVAAAASSASGSQTSGATGSSGSDPPYYNLGVLENTSCGDATASGMIAAWLGTLASIPAAWGLCDGTNGAPDLRDKMVVAAASDLTDVGDTGGATTHDHTDPSTHTHTAAHTHTLTIGAQSGSENATGSGVTHSSNTHTHTGGASGSGGGTSGSSAEAVATSNVYPPYRTVAWIQLQSFPQTATPDPIAIPIVVPAPTLDIVYAASPDPVAVPIVVPAPTLVISENTINTPDPIAIPVVTPDPTLVFGEKTVAPDPVVVPVVVTDPAVVLLYTASPDPVAVPLAIPDPTLVFGEKIITPDPIAIPIVVTAPSATVPFTATPDPIVITITIPEVGLAITFQVSAPPELVASATQVASALSGRYGPVSLRFRYTRRTRTNVLIDEIDGVITPGSVTLDNSRAVARDLSITFDRTLMPDDFDPSSDIIGIAVEVNIAELGIWTSIPVGLFVLESSESRWRGTNEIIPAHGSDLASLLVRSVRTAAYTVTAGTVYTTAVEALIARHGLNYSIPASLLTLPYDITWPAGTTDYQITRDLLFGINYYPLWADANGVIRTRERIDPSTESPAVTYQDTAEPRMISALDDYVTSVDRKVVNRASVIIDDPRSADFGYEQRENADTDAPNSTAALAYGDAATVLTSSVNEPTVITTSADHGFSDGVQVLIADHDGSTPDINGSHIITVLSPTTFTIPIAVTVGGTGGTAQATTVQLLEVKGDSDPSTRAVYDATRAGEIAEFELRWAAALAQVAALPTFLDPRREPHEFYSLDIEEIEDEQQYAALGWSMELRPGAIMQHSVGKATAIDILEPAK